MDGKDLRTARLRKGWTQGQVAAKLGVTQAYVSMLERRRRVLSGKLAQKLVGLVNAPVTALPLPERSTRRMSNADFGDELGALGYPGFAYLRRKPRMNPAELLFLALNESNLEARVAEGLPWLVLQYPDLDWDWLRKQSKLHDRQNRLGFVTALGLGLAEARNDHQQADRLQRELAALETSRLTMEDTLSRESMTTAERNWLKNNRTLEAAHWNVLSDLQVKDLVHALS
jgi:transcriptional regulator with XRE-family HTH domain